MSVRMRFLAALITLGCGAVGFTIVVLLLRTVLG